MSKKGRTIKKERKRKAYTKLNLSQKQVIIRGYLLEGKLSHHFCRVGLLIANAVLNHHFHVHRS